MKKCPYCAEEIQDEAIVCRYCGRDLQAASLSTETRQENNTPIQISVWKQGAKASAVLTGLYLIGQLLTPQYIPELVGNLTLGLLATFFGWWIICAGVVWLWRQLGGGVIALLVVIGIAIFFGYSQNRASFAVPTVVPTRTPAPISTKVPTKTQPAPKLTDTCTFWTDLRQSNIGETMCVKGDIEQIVGNSESSGKFRAYFKGNLPEGYVWTDGTPSIFYFMDETYYYPDLIVGDCVSATGRIGINQQGELFMRIDGELKNCQ